MLQYTENHEDVLDFIAVGAGPSNLSLAAQAMQKYPSPRRKWLVLEKNSTVRWHPGMLLPGSRLDTHFAKDLVTMVDPTSKFSFLNYLKVHGKLEFFLNCGNTSPFRADFDQYIQWVAAELGDHVQTSCEVTRIEPAQDGTFIVHTNAQNEKMKTLRARHVVVGAGAKPQSVCGVDLDHPRVIHSSDFLYKMKEMVTGDKVNKVLVVGSGQSAAELINYCLVDTKSDVSCVLGDFGLTTKEGTAFINESYNGDFIDRFHKMSQDMRGWFVEKRKNMNYGVVDDKLIGELYNNYYYARNFENRGIEFLQFSKLVSAKATDTGVDVEIDNRETGETNWQNFDYVIMACGYDTRHSLGLFEGCLSDSGVRSDGLPVVNRDYSVNLSDQSANAGKVFMNGNVSQSHGPAGDVLSVIAHRSQDILSAIKESVSTKPRTTETV